MSKILDTLLRACALAALRDRESAVTFELIALYRLVEGGGEPMKDICSQRAGGAGHEEPPSISTNRDCRD